MVKRIRHPGIVVGDLEKSLHFWSDLLGFKVVREMDEHGPHMDRMLGIENVRVKTVKMIADEGGSMLELLAFQSPGPVRGQPPAINTIGLTHVAIEVDDAEETFRRLASAGAKFNSPPQLSPDGFSKVAFCRDPDGTFVEIIQRGLTK